MPKAVRETRLTMIYEIICHGAVASPANNENADNVNRAASKAAVDPSPRSGKDPGMTFLRWDDSSTQIAKLFIF